MKVCYLIQTYKNPEQVYRLIRTLKKGSPDSLIIVSHDFSHCSIDVADLPDLSGVMVFPGQGGRGDFCTTQRYLDTIDWLLSNNIDFDWLSNISAQDYPIQPLSQIDDFLSTTSYDGFIEHFEVFSKQSKWSFQEAYSRYFFKYKTFDLNNWQKKLLKPFKLINYLQRLLRINFSYYQPILGWKISPPFNDKFICYGGYFFCTLSRKCVQYLYEFTQANPDVVDYYRNVCVPEESILQTLLVNSQLFNLCNDSKRYSDFRNSKHGAPRIFTTNDYPELVQSDAHFARKFDLDQDKNILDLLDQKILPITSDHS
jgi:hypothetical protein